MDLLPALLIKIQADDIRLGGISYCRQALQRYPGQKAFDGGLEQGVGTQQP